MFGGGRCHAQVYWPYLAVAALQEVDAAVKGARGANSDLYHERVAIGLEGLTSSL